LRRLALIASLALTLCLPASAHASFGFLPGAEGLSASAQNKDTTPTTQAGAHPYALRLDIGLNTAGPSSDGDLRDLRVSLPPGFLINPTAAEECLAADFKAPRVSPHEASASGESCPNSTQVGVIEARVGSQTRHFGLFNLTAPFGSPFALGFAPFGKPVVLVGKLREGDSGLDLLLDELPSSIDLQSVKLEIWGTPWQPVHDEERGNC
jgi:hypothetical protein